MERGYRESGAWSLPLSLEPYVDAVVASYKSLSRSSLRTQGPITPGLRSEKRPLLKCRSESPRRMGPCVRRDDSLENSICDSLARKRERERSVSLSQRLQPGLDLRAARFQKRRQRQFFAKRFHRLVGREAGPVGGDLEQDAVRLAEIKTSKI